MTIKPEHVEWCREMFRVLADGATWDLPSSGLSFQKCGNELVLVERMPHMAGMSIRPDQLIEHQNRVFDETREGFGAAGIVVRDETNAKRSDH